MRKSNSSRSRRSPYRSRNLSNLFTGEKSLKASTDKAFLSKQSFRRRACLFLYGPTGEEIALMSLQERAGGRKSSLTQRLRRIDDNVPMPLFEQDLTIQPSAHVATQAVQRKFNLSAAATMGFAQSGVCVRSPGLRIFPRSMWSTTMGLGVLPAAGSASALLS